MAYLDYPVYADLKKFSHKHKISMSQLIREGITSRMSGGDRYLSGFNDGVNSSINVVNANKAAKMRFPSGKSFAELVIEDLQKLSQKDGNEKTNVTGADEGSSDAEGQGDQSMGL
jgi:hypothetical protein